MPIGLLLQGDASLINLPMLVSSLLGFLILFFVLKATLFKPVLGIIDERRDSIEQAFREVDQARTEVAQMKRDYEARMAEIVAEAQGKMQDAVARGEALSVEIRQAAEDQRAKLLARTQEDIAREKDKLLAELRHESVELSFQIAERVLREGLDRQVHDRLVAQFAADLKRLS